MRFTLMVGLVLWGVFGVVDDASAIDYASIVKACNVGEGYNQKKSLKKQLTRHAKASRIRKGQFYFPAICVRVAEGKMRMGSKRSGYASQTFGLKYGSGQKEVVFHEYDESYLYGRGENLEVLVEFNHDGFYFDLRYPRTHVYLRTRANWIKGKVYENQSVPNQKRSYSEASGIEIEIVAVENISICQCVL